VEKIFDQPGDDTAHLCKECKDERKDKPFIGISLLGRTQIWLREPTSP